MNQAPDIVVNATTRHGNGNRIAYTSSSGAVTATYDARDRLLSYGDLTYTYSANGELESRAQNGQTATYSYDELGNLRDVVLPGGIAIEYVIDGQNRRAGKKVNGSLGQGFLYEDQLQPAAELDGAGAVVSRFVYGSGENAPDFIIKGGVTYRILSDHLGSPRLVVNATTGQVVQQMDYDEFGRVILDTNPGFQPFGFASGLYDRQVGFVRFGARDYDPETGRWTAKDPILFDGGGANLYSYSLNDPVNLTDPSGTELPSPPFSPPPSSQDQQEACAARAFRNNYNSMRLANWKKSDKYFHCKANCEATQCGPAGYNRACQLGDLREWLDQHIKGDPPSASAADQAANAYGRAGALANPKASCAKICAVFRPHGLPPQY